MKRWIPSITGILLVLMMLLLVGCRPTSASTSVALQPTSTSTMAPSPTLTSTTTPSPTPTRTSTPSPSPTAKPRPTPTLTPTPTPLPETTLWLHVVSAEGQPVPIAQALLFMEDWALYEWITLTAESNTLVIKLNMDSVAVPWEKWQGKTETVYRLYVEADGYAAIESRPMPFIGTYIYNSHSETYGPVFQVPVEFLGQPVVQVAAGETKDMEVVVRKLQKRTLRFVDGNQAPLSGVQVWVSLFGSGANHCGHANPAWSLGKGISDKTGRVTIPDGDYEYLIELEKPGYELGSNDHFTTHWEEDYEYPDGRVLILISYLSGQEIVVELDKRQPQRLEMVVLRKGEPAADRTLYADQWSCYCALCGVELATTDAQGRIALDEFYPDMWWSIYFTDTTDFAWEADPRELPTDQVIQVNLGE